MVVIKSKSNYLPDDFARLIAFYRQNPVIAANHLLIRDGEPVRLAPIQAKVLNEWWFSKFCVLTASRGMGKSFLGALYITLKALLYPNSRLGIFGPSFRQSKFVFQEIEKFYNNSPLFQECVSKKPVIGNDQAICILKPPAAGYDPNSIVALPVGNDGGKIRGQRLSEFILDECVQMPEVIFRSSIKPMLATTISPMKRVEEIKKLKEEFGDTFDSSLLEGGNSYKVITSGYYQFNYWWQEIMKTWHQISKGSTAHSLRFVPYTDLPDGFLDMSAVNDAKAKDPKHIFLTEWCAEWIADSEGAFPMSLLESCRDDSILPRPGRAPNDKGRYVFGIDVARERDSSSIVVVELGYPSKVVWISELEEKPFPDQAKNLFSLIHRFEPVRIYMDAGGGGLGLRDYLADPESVGIASSMKIIETDAPLDQRGKRILRMCDFSPAFIEDANNNTKTLLEQGAILLPHGNHPIEAKRKQAGKKDKKEVDLVQILINQTASIVITPTPYTGKLRFDLPKNASSKNYAEKVKMGVRKKDLYTAFILAGSCVYDMAYRIIEDRRMAEKGVIKQIEYKEQISSSIGQKDPRYTISDNRIDRLAGTMPSSSSPNKLIIPNGGIIVTRNGKNK